MSLVANFIRKNTEPQRIIFFGSILTDNFDLASDIDLVIIYPTFKIADEARRTLYSLKQPQILHPLEMLCVDEGTFQQKSQIGGLYFLVSKDGLTFY